MRNPAKHLLITFIALLTFFTMTHQARSAEFEIKFSVLAPEGSTWVNTLKEMDKELQAGSNGRLALKIYAGGVSGDEKDVLRKMKINQIHAAGFTGVGLGQIVPSIRVLELPLLFKSYAEVDYVKSKIQKDLESQFDQKGYVLLGWAEAGFVNIFSNKPIKTKADMNGTKWWAWSGDPLVEAMYAALGIVPNTAALPDVMSQLGTNGLDAVYAPPAAAIALQWTSKTKFMTDINLANATGAIVMNKPEFTKLPADLQALLKNTSEKYSNKLVGVVRQENSRSVNALKSNGIQVLSVAPADLDELQKSASSIRPKLVGRLYSQDLLSRVEGLVQEYRKSHP